MKRRISTEEDFMNHIIDDILYGYLVCNATYDKERLYLNKAKYRECLPTIQTLLNVRSRKTVYNHLQTLKDYGLLSEDAEAFYFPYNVDSHYVLIEKELLEYLVITTNQNMIKLYAYLLSKYQMKKDYTFTKKELAVSALGYSETSWDNASVLRFLDIMLESFQCQNILRFETGYKEKAISDTQVIQVPFMRITKLAVSKSEIKQCKINRVRE